MDLVPNPCWLTINNETCTTILKKSYSFTVTSHFVCISAVCPQEAAERTNTTYVNNANYSKIKCLYIESNLSLSKQIYPYVYILPILKIWIKYYIITYMIWRTTAKANYSKVSHLMIFNLGDLHITIMNCTLIILIKSDYTPYCVYYSSWEHFTVAAHNEVFDYL